MSSSTAYTSTLDAASLERAKKELNEDEKNREGAVQTLREWVMIQPWLKCPTDTNFLLRFLRTQKFSQLRARDILETYWRKRTENAEWFANKDTNDPKIQDVIKSGFFLRLPRVDKDGRIYFLLRVGALDADYIKKTLGIENLFRAMTCIQDWINMDERVQVNGLVAIVDLTGYTMQHRAVIHTPENVKKIINTMQHVYPMRVKAIHMYNLPPIFEVVLGIAKTFMKAKFKDRLKTHGRSLVSVYEEIDMSVLPEEYLDDDYKGPNSGSIKSISEYMLKELTKPEVNEHIKSLTNGQYGVDLKLKPSDDEPQASFRKLNVD